MAGNVINTAIAKKFTINVTVFGTCVACFDNNHFNTPALVSQTIYVQQWCHIKSVKLSIKYIGRKHEE